MAMVRVVRTIGCFFLKVLALGLFVTNTSLAAVQVTSIAVFNDDAEQSGTTVLTGSPTLELVHDGVNRQKVGLRFNNIAVAQGLDITSAYVQFKAAEITTQATNLKITGQAADNPVAFSLANNIFARPTTNAHTLWSPPPWNSVGEAAAGQRTPDISAIIQEIVNRPGWQAGNSVVIFIEGYGERVAASFNGDPAGAPQLHLEYLEATQDAPVVDAGTDQIISLPNTAMLAGSATDDGLPAVPGAVTTNWDQVSGDVAVQLSDPTLLNPVASFPKAGTYKLRLTAFDGERHATDTVTIQVLPAASAPTISSISPTSAQVATAITVSGQNFSSAQSVRFGGVDADFRIVSDSVIHATVPPGAITGAIQVQNAWGLASSANNFTLLASPAVLVGAGDIHDCIGPAEGAAQIIDGIPGTVMPVGDLVYPDGTGANFSDCYAPTWGRHDWRARPVPGNHEYAAFDAAPYFQRFGASAGEPGKGYYSYDIGEWHVVALNSECVDVGGCYDGSPQAEWLRQDLATHPTACTLAYFHKPRYGSSGYTEGALGDLWQILYEGGVDLAVSGHGHFYERFARQDNAANLDAAGVRQFIVGTGGAGLGNLNGLAANSEMYIDDKSGVLKLVLNSGSYDWEFLTVGGVTPADAGTDNCSQTNQAPVVDAGPDQSVVFPASADLAGNVIDDGLPAPAATSWSQVAGFGTVSFGDPSDPGTTATFPYEDRYILRLSADDGEFIASDDVTIEAFAAGSQLYVFNRAVTNGADDAEERLSSGAVLVGNADLELTYDSGAADNQAVGLRFNDIQLPPNASVVDAYIQFQADEADAGAIDLVVYGQAVPNATAFTSAVGNVTGRTKTSAGVSWQPPDWPTVGMAGEDQRTPNLSPILRELVSLPGWASGNSMVFIIEGTGQRVAESFEGDAAGAPKLYVEYVDAALPIDVPNVTNQVQATAESNLVSAGLTVGTVTTASDDTVPSGSVISQNPASCTSCVQPGTPVDLVVSTGPPVGC